MSEALPPADLTPSFLLFHRQRSSNQRHRRHLNRSLSAGAAVAEAAGTRVLKRPLKPPPRRSSPLWGPWNRRRSPSAAVVVAEAVVATECRRPALWGGAL